VKDLMRKQELLRRYDPTLEPNPLVGLVKKSRRPVADDAARLLKALSLDLSDIRAAKTKEAAVDLVISRLEAKQVLVSRSAQHHMPQEIPRRAKFSGMTIKDKRVPFIFLASGNEGDNLEPAGRRLFTLVLLTVLIGQETFTPVNYDGHTKDEDSPRAQEVAAEILMPRAELRNMRFPDLDALKEAATKFKVTPSAVAMRARHLGCIERDEFVEFMDALEDEYNNRPKSVMQSPAPVKALLKYNGTECSRRMLGILDAKLMNRNEFRRVMFFNKLAASQISDFQAAVG
jgi:Zn-dependent peptidase ImmA (M78 family)